MPSIVVLACTGVGKSTFLNMLSHGHDLLKLKPDQHNFLAKNTREAVTKETSVKTIRTSFAAGGET